jgi:hypothetical protein
MNNRRYKLRGGIIAAIISIILLLMLLWGNNFGLPSKIEMYLFNLFLLYPFLIIGILGLGAESPLLASPTSYWIIVGLLIVISVAIHFYIGTRYIFILVH